MTLFDIAYDDFKREDTTNTIIITLYTDDKQPITPDSSHTWKAKVSKGDKYVGEYPVTISGNTIKLSSSNLARLPNGDYGLELWETYSGSTTIYPSAGMMEFRVHRNANDTLGTVDQTTDINAIIDDLRKARQNIKVVATNTLPAGSKASVTQSIANDENQLTFNIPQGPKGDKGDKGDKGATGDRGPIGPQGIQGPQGKQGDMGPAPTLKIGTVTKLGPDQTPTANLSGGNGAYTLDLGIPQGVQSEHGNVGPEPTLKIGTVTKLGPDQMPTASLSGGNGAYTLDLGIPQGPKGDDGQTGPQGEQGIQGPKGEQGNAGPAPTLKIGTVTKLSPDQMPTASLSGGSGSYTLNLGIPQGPKGENGNDGHTPVKGVDYWTDADKNEILNETKQYVDDAILNGKW